MRDASVHDESKGRVIFYFNSLRSVSWDVQNQAANRRADTQALELGDQCSRYLTFKSRTKIDEQHFYICVVIVNMGEG